MPVDPVSVGLGVASMASGKKANNKAKKEADAANRMSRAMEERMVKLWDVLFGRAQSAEKQGVFDPEKRIAAMEQDTARYESKDLGNLAGAMRVAGYQPGDSEIGTRLDAVKTKYRGFMDNLRNEIRTQSWFDQQNAYSSAGGANLGGAMASAQNRAQDARSRMQNPAGFMTNLISGLRPAPGGAAGAGFALGGRRPAAATY